MAKKVTWNSLDRAAQEVLNDELRKTGYSYQRLEDCLHGDIASSRIYDIRTGRRAPVRWSEFVELVSLTKLSQEEAMNAVFSRAQEIDQAEYDEMSDAEKQEAYELMQSIDEQDRILAQNSSVTKEERWNAMRVAELRKAAHDTSDAVPSAKERYRALHASDLDLAAKRGDIDAEQQAMEEMP